jgi:hypothetical protein
VLTLKKSYLVNVAKQITIIKAQTECYYVKKKLEFRNYVPPGVLIRYYEGQQVNQQEHYLYDKATTYPSDYKKV